MPDDAMKLRKFIQELDKYIKELKSKPARIDTIDAYALGYLAGNANQFDTEQNLYDIADEYENGNITTQKYVEGIKEIGKQYDV